LGCHVEPYAGLEDRETGLSESINFSSKQPDLVKMVLMDDEPDGPMREFVPLLANGMIVVPRVFASGGMERIGTRRNSVPLDLTARTA
jgi:hypothetical protein